MERRLGRSGLRVSALGLGTARIGGLGYSRAGDRETHLAPEAVAASKVAIRRALDLGISFFDTADIYGAGRGERILGEALGNRRRAVTIATKFGERFDEETGAETDDAITPEFVARACDGSLRRLGTETIDLYLFHVRDFPLQRAAEIRDTLEELAATGKIRFYGWSTDDTERASVFAEGRHCTAIEHRLNVFDDAPAMLALCETHDLASVNRVPLLTGVLTGRWRPNTPLPATDRRSDWFADERFQELLACAESLRPVLTDDGRTYVQGALGWIWARSGLTIPIPGFRTVEQVEGLADAMNFGPLSEDRMVAVDHILGRHGTASS